MTTIVEAAIIRSFRCPPSVINVYRPSGKVLTSLELVATIGHKNEFHAAIENQPASHETGCRNIYEIYFALRIRAMRSFSPEIQVKVPVAYSVCPSLER